MLLFLKKNLFFPLKLILIISFLFPFLWLVTTAFKTYEESIAYPPTLFFASPQWENFQSVFISGPFFTYTLNSVLVVVCTMVLQFFIMVPAAYAFARYKFKGSNIMFGLVMLAFMVPNQITFVPVYLLMTKSGLLNTLLPQIIPFAANAFGIFMLRQNFMQISDEIIEASLLDNASEFKLVTRIMLPMAYPTLITIGLFSFINNWNSYFWPLVMTDSKALRPLTVGLAMLKVSEGTLNWPVVMAGNLFLLTPVLLAYLFARKRMMASIGYGGIK